MRCHLREGAEMRKLLLGLLFLFVGVPMLLGTLASVAPDASPANAPKGALASADTAAPQASWTYSRDTDQMRGTVTNYAMLQSTNQLQFDFPYNGGSTGAITLRKKAKSLDVMLAIEHGQFMCHSFTNGTVAVKFDDGPVQHYACGEPSDGTSNVIFIEGPRHFVTALKRSHRLIVEAEFFQEGNRQLTFKTAGLKWD